MSFRDEKIGNLLKRELALTGLPAALVFGLASIFVFFYYFEAESQKSIIQTLAILIFFANISRYVISKRMLASAEFKSQQKVLFGAILINGICWSAIFAIGTIATQAASVHFGILLVLQAAFVSGSLITLSVEKLLFIPYQVINTIAMVGALYYLHHSTHETDYLYLLSIYVVFCIYQFKQFFSFRQLTLERIQGQAELSQRNQELESSQRTIVDQSMNMIQAAKATALGEMASGLSHEVNNSLMVILGSVQSLERTLRQNHGPNPSYELKFERARGAIQRIRTVIDGLRYFSHHMGPVPKEETSLREIMERTLNFSHDMVKNNAVVLEVADAPELKVTCQPIQITQILFNLIKNAYDALERAPDADQKWVRIDFEQKKSEILVLVKNGGPKINSEHTPKLFQQFFTTKEVGKGLGLSLSNSKGIAQEHQGDVTFDERAPHTTFILRLPCS
jgi:signal transduction histidine kinase